MPSIISATGWPKSRVRAACSRISGFAGQQRAGVHEHERVVVDVDDPGLRRDLLGDLVRARPDRQAHADVKELADPGLAGQVADRTDQETALLPGDFDDAGEYLHQHVADLTVGREVVLAAQQVVPDPGRMRHPGSEPWRRGSLALR